MAILFLKMFCLSDSKKIKIIDTYPNNFDNLIEENCPSFYFYIVYNYFALNEVLINLKSLKNDKNELSHTKKTLTLIVNNFANINHIFKENYHENYSNFQALRTLFDEMHCKYFLIKIYNEIENIKFSFLFEVIERKKVLDFIENCVGIKPKKPQSNGQENNFENIEVLEIMPELLKIQNVLLSFLAETKNKNSQIMKNYFTILIIKIVSSIQYFPFHEDKICFSDFASFEEIYFNYILNNVEELKTQNNNLLQVQIP